jgi:hypothetical protein
VPAKKEVLERAYTGRGVEAGPAGELSPAVIPAQAIMQSMDDAGCPSFGASAGGGQCSEAPA